MKEKSKSEDNQGNPTWPEKLSAKKIADMKADPKQVMVFYAQYQNDPMETELTDFKNEAKGDDDFRRVSYRRKKCQD